MIDTIIDALMDTLKLLPYLFITFVILEFIEHKLSHKNEKILKENEKYGPLLGGLLGAIPQCGFSAMASNLFSSKVITRGTLIAVFLSTSDEMLPIMLSENASIPFMLKIVLFKVIVGIIIGFIVDLVLNKKEIEEEHIHELCVDEHCSCDEHGIIRSSLTHTIKISLFILIANIVINLAIYEIGEDNLSNLVASNSILAYFIASLIGLIPNCASSVIITQVYLAKLISIGTLLSGLLTGSGLGILLLFKTNKNLKENIAILSFIYFVGVILGIVVDIII